MSYKFKGEDLFIMAMPELEETHSVAVAFRQLNGMRDILRSKGIMYDLGQRELESLSYDFPQNVIISSSEIHIEYSRSLGEYVKMRLRSYSVEDVEMMYQLWEEAK